MMIDMRGGSRLRCRERAAAVLVTGGVLIALLAGCTPGSPTESDAPITSTATSSPASPDEKAAYEGALSALQRLMQITAALYESGGGDTAPLAAVASGEVLRNAIASVQHYAEDGYVASGKIALEPYDHDVRSNENQAPAVPYGEVVIYSCIDYSDWTLTASDGSPAPRSGPDRSTFEHHGVLDTVSHEWKVTRAAATANDC